MIDINEIVRYLPHRYPFLLIDRVLQLEKGVSLKALKNVTANEPIFTGHFPQYPVFPGVLILEAMAQASAVLAFKEFDGYPGPETLYLLAGIDNARFKREVVPGDSMIIDVELIRSRRGISKFAATATVDEKTCCSAEVLIAKNEIDS